MKKNFLYYVLAVFCTMCVIAACDDDDVDKKVTVDDIIGTYTGTLKIGEQSIPNSTITLTKINADSINMELKNFQFNEMAFGDIHIPCIITPDSEKDELHITGTTNLDVETWENVSAVLSGDADHHSLDIDINITNVPQINTLILEFEGKK